MVLRDQPSTRSGTVLDSAGSSKGTVTADTILYATMTGTDVTLYRLSETFNAVTARTTMSALTLSVSSGSPVVSQSSGEVIAINNTINESGAMCTVNNPCEVDAAGNRTATKGRGYAQETYWFMTCLTGSRTIDLTIPGLQARRRRPCSAAGQQPAPERRLRVGPEQLDRHVRPDHEQHRPTRALRHVEAVARWQRVDVHGE